MRIAFLIWHDFQYTHFLEMIRFFSSQPGVKATIVIWRKNNVTDGCFTKKFFSKAELPIRIVEAGEVESLDGEYDFILSPNRLPGQVRLRQSKHVMVQYSLAKDLTVYNLRWCLADIGLVYGKISEGVLAPLCPVFAVGNPRFDPYFTDRLDHEILSHYRSYLNPNKQTVAFMPTWGDLSSSSQCRDFYRELADNYNVISKEHHLTGVCATINGKIVSDPQHAVHYDEALYIYRLADVVVSDYSGSIFDALYLGKPVVLLRPKQIDLQNHKKIRIQSIEISRACEIGPVAETLDQLKPAIEGILNDRGGYKQANEQLVKQCFEHSGDGCRSAYAALQACLGEEDIITHTHYYLRESVYELIEQLNKARGKSGSKSQKKKKTTKWRTLRNRLLRVGFSITRKFQTESAYLKTLGSCHQMLRDEPWFRKRHINLLVSSASLEGMTALYSLDELLLNSSSKFLKFLLDKEHFVLLGIACSKWLNLPLTNRIEGHLRYEYAASAIGLPIETVIKYRQKLLNEVESYPNHASVVGVLQILGRLNHTARLLDKCKETKAYKTAGHLDELLCDLKPVIEVAGKNLLLLPQHHHAITADNTELPVSDLPPASKLVEVHLPVQLLTFTEKLDLLTIRQSHVRFYQLLIKRIHDAGHVLVPLIQYGFHAPWVSKNRISFTWHTIRGLPMQYHVKYSALTNHLTMDPDGFAGWASIAKADEGIREAILKMDREAAHETWLKLRREYIEANVSKYLQKPDQHCELDAGYIFFPMQVVHDLVAELSYVKCLDLLKYLVEKCKAKKWKLVIKRHPLCNNAEVAEALTQARKEPHVILSDASIHQLINGADAVVTVNSGVGFEALMHLKKVITTGSADYSAATTIAKTVKDLDLALDGPDAFLPDTNFIKQFLYYYMTEYLILDNDEATLKRRINKILNLDNNSPAHA